jgi:opacity protein-like surface antigen
MSIASRSQRVLSLVFCLFAALTVSSAAQATSSNPTLDKHLSRIDFAVNGIGIFTKDVTGTNDLNANVTQHTGSTLGALITIRYTKSPYIGGEFNYTYSRYTQSFRQAGTKDFIYIVGGVQNNVSEYSLGYVMHPPHQILGASPFISVGAGTTAFRPTKGGGQSLINQARATYYYSAGLEKELTPHFGIRAQFRQAFFKAPDFGTNYLTLQKHTWTIEPGIGFVIHF